MIETKLLVPPARPGFVARGRLFEQLDSGETARLTLVCAPAGFGKTTLLSTWTQRAGHPVCWFSLDEGDNDPSRFLAYFTAAIQQALPEAGRSVTDLLRPAQMSFFGATRRGGEPVEEAALASLINDLLATKKPLAVVLDDYHLIQAEGIHRLLRFLVERQPPELQIVISTRHDPPLSLSRLRARGELIEIREPDLRFTQGEVETFLEGRLQAPVSREVLLSLEKRTEGWAAGLQLAALSLQREEDHSAFLSTFRGDDRYVADYLLEEVLHQQPEEIQLFLLQTSILNRLSAGLCQTLLGDQPPAGSPQQTLEALEAAHLFLLPLDHKRQWYRYHSLFADFLRHQLEERNPGKAVELHKRASRWYEQTGDIEQAIHHAFAIQDWERAAWLAEQYSAPLVYGGRLATFLRWIKRIPQEVVEQRAYLCVDTGWAYALDENLDLALHFAQAGESALADFKPISVVTRKSIVHAEEVRGDLTTLRAFIARLQGSTADVIRYSHLALEQLPADAYTVRGVVALNLGLLYHQSWEQERCIAAMEEAVSMTLKSGENLSVAVNALAIQGNAHLRQGRFDQANALYHRAIKLSTEEGLAPGPIPAACLGYLGLANICYHRNQTNAARDYLEKARELAQSGRLPDVVLHTHLSEARLALLAGDLSKTKKVLKETCGALQPGGREPLESQRAALAAEVLLEEGRLAQADSLLSDRNLLPEPERPPDWDRVSEHLLFVRLKLHQEKTSEALAWLAWLEPFLRESGLLEYRVEANLLQAVANRMKRKTDRAIASLKEATSLAEANEFISPYLKLGSLSADLLRQTGITGSQFVLQVETALAKRAATLKASLEGVGPADEALAEPLTGREKQVLHLLAAGLTSNEIAEELILSVSTVRSYMKTLYQKLGVHSRSEAVARGESLDLL